MFLYTGQLTETGRLNYMIQGRELSLVYVVNSFLIIEMEFGDHKQEDVRQYHFFPEVVNNNRVVSHPYSCLGEGYIFFCEV